MAFKSETVEGFVCIVDGNGERVVALYRLDTSIPDDGTGIAEFSGITTKEAISVRSTFCDVGEVVRVNGIMPNVKIKTIKLI